MIGRYSAAFLSWSLALTIQLVVEFSIVPLATLAFADATAERTASSPILYLFSRLGLASMRTAGCDEPHTNTWPTPSTCESFWPMIESAASYISSWVRASEVMARMRTGASAGLILRYVGLLGRSAGRYPR